MKNIDSTGVTFVNTVISRGVFNGNVNLTFGTALFSPIEENGELKIDTDIAISARLRMDVSCAKELYNSLGALLKAIDELEGEEVPGEDPLVPSPVVEGKRH